MSYSSGFRHGVGSLKHVALLVVAGLRRRKLGSILVGITIFIASLLVTSAVGVLTNTGRAFDATSEALYAGNLILKYSADRHTSDELQQWWRDREGVLSIKEYLVYDVSDNLMINGEAVGMSAYLTRTPARHGGHDRIHILESTVLDDSQHHTPRRGGVWVPSTLADSYRVVTGDTIDIVVAGSIATFAVEALVVDPQFNSRWGSKRFWIHPDDFDRLVPPAAVTTRLLSVRVARPELIDELLFAFFARSELALQVQEYSYREIRGDYLLVYNIIGSVVGIIAALSLVVAGSILSGNLSTFIRSEYRLIGITRALGCTPGEIAASYFGQAMLIALVFTALGLTSGYLVARRLLETMLASAGLLPDTIKLRFAVLVAALSVPSVTGMCTWLAVLKARSIKPAVAIRRGYAAEWHRRRRARNRMPRLSVSAPLFIGFRNVAVHGGYVSTAIGITLTVIITTVSFSVTSLLARAMVDRAYWGVADADVSFYHNGAEAVSHDHQTLRSQIASHDNVESVTSSSAPIAGYIPAASNGRPLPVTGFAYSTAMRDAGLVNREGIHPVRPGDISLSDRVMALYDLRIGDDVTVVINGSPRSLVVSGSFQISENRGYSFRVSEATYRSIEPNYSPAVYYVQLRDLGRWGETIRELEAQSGSLVFGVERSNVINDIERTFGATMPYVRGVCTLVSLLFFIVSFILIHNDTLHFVSIYRKSFAVLRAVGFSHVQLQLAAAYRVLVPLGVGVLIGIPVALVLAPGILNMAFYSSGFGTFGVSFAPFHIVSLFSLFGAFGFLSALLSAKNGLIPTATDPSSE